MEEKKKINISGIMEDLTDEQIEELGKALAEVRDYLYERLTAKDLKRIRRKVNYE